MACRRKRWSHTNVGRIARYLSKSFIGAKEECLVFYNWTTERSAKLVSLEWSGTSSSAGDRGRERVQNVEEVASVQGAVPQIFEHVAVKLISSTLGDNGRLAAHNQAIFRAE